MRKPSVTRGILLAALTVCACQANDILYNNTDVDQQFSVFYSTGFTEIGDQLQFISAGLLSSLDTQFYNNGADATFDATLTFYQVGSPVGSQIGTPFTVTGISIASGASQTVTFASLNNLLVPQNVIVTLAVQNVSTDGEIGVNFFDPPTVGTSDHTFFIANDGTGLAQASTFFDFDNLYFQIDGTAVPEPATAGVTFGVLAVLADIKRRLKS